MKKKTKEEKKTSDATDTLFKHKARTIKKIIYAKKKLKKSYYENF